MLFPLDSEIGIWVLFIGLITGMLIFDLGVMHKKHTPMSLQKSMFLSVLYIIFGLSFSGWVYYLKGGAGAQDYLIGYLVEKSLSLDNIFVISLIFGAFKVPAQYQHRVLFWGILGVLILRGIMIGFGALLIHRFEWITIVFAVFLLWTGIKMLSSAHAMPDVQSSALYQFLLRHLRMTPELHQEKFIVVKKEENGKKRKYVTPLFVALLLIEAADVVFAIDSVPAIFSITTDTYIVYTSNIFAILGLRSLYFALAHMIERFSYLKHALALILIFIGGKVIAVWTLPIEKIPSPFSLGVILLLLAGGILVSLLANQKKDIRY